MKFKSPSPKVLAFLLIMVILITITIVSSKLLGNKSKNDTGNSNLINLTIKNDLNSAANQKDSDNDDLPDWQEALWGTNPNNPDTDGDGTNDGKEVGLGRNPLVPGPNDKILSDREIALQYKPAKTDPNSVTSILSKNLLLRLAQLQQSGQNSSQSSDEMAQGLVDKALADNQIPEKYPESIFLTFDSTDKQKLEEYKNKIIEIQKNELVKINPNKKDLDPIITGFKNMAFQLSIISVPRDLLSVHAKIANDYYIAAEALINLKMSDKDPVLGVLSIPIYKKVSEEQPILYQQVQNYLEDNGIIFNTN